MQTGNESKTQESLNAEAAVAPHHAPSPWKLLGLGALLVGLACYLKSVGLVDRVEDLREWIQGMGQAGPLVAVGVFALGVAAAIPLTVLMVLTGALFHPFTGVAVISAGATLGSCLAFLISRYILGASVVNWLKHSKAFVRLDDLTHHRGALVVLITRLVPVFPFNIINYCYGLTRIRFSIFALYTWLGMLPEIVVVVCGFHVFEHAFGSGTVPWHTLAILLVVLVALGLGGRRALRYLKFNEIPSTDDNLGVATGP